MNRRLKTPLDSVAAEHAAHVGAIVGTLKLANDLLETVDLELLERELDHVDTVGPRVDALRWEGAGRAGQLEAQGALFRWAIATRHTLKELQRIYSSRPAPAKGRGRPRS